MFGSIRSRLILLLILVTLPSLGVIFYHAQTERELAIKISTEKASKAAHQLAVTQRRIIKDTENYLIFLSGNAAVQDPSSTACNEYLSMVLQLNTTYVNFGVPQADGELLCNAFPLTKRVNVFDRPYFQESLRTRSFAISTFQHDRAANTTSVNFAYPVISDTNDEVVGLVVAVLSLEWWSKQLESFQLSPNSVAYISDTQGNIVANYPADPKGLGKPLAKLGILDNGHIDDSSKTEHINISDKHGRVYIHTPLYIKNDGNVVMLSVGIPFDQQLSSAKKKYLYTLFAFTACILAISIFAHLALNSSVITPLEHLGRATAALEKGILARLPSKHAARELTVLQKRFENMAQTRLEAENVAKLRNEELNTVFEALPDQYFRINQDNIILDHKAIQEASFIQSDELLIGRNLLSVLPEETANLFATRLADHRRRLPRWLPRQNKFLIDITDWEFSVPAPLTTDVDEEIFEARASTIPETGDTIIVIRDISEQKRAEASLHLAAMVYRNSSEGMVIIDSDGAILDVNPSFIRAIGFSAKEMIGNHISMLRSGRHEESFYLAIRDCVKNNGRWEGEIYNRRKNGEIYPSWLIIDTIYGEDKEAIQHVALYRDITEKKKADELIWRHAHFDALTGLPNRIMVLDRIEQEKKKTQRSARAMATLLLDLDRFKEINDTMGHDVGDLLLQQTAQRLQSCVRNDDTIARQGGDEFIIILNDLDPSDHIAIQIDQIASNILTQLEKPFKLRDQVVYVTGSIGIAIYPNDGESTEDLLKAADQAMYRAKNTGKNRFQYFTKSMQDAAITRMSLVRDLRQAVRSNQFELFYQPIVDLSSGMLAKAEALIRWHHPNRGLVNPGEFIPVAEETHMINAIGDFVFEAALQSCKKLHSVFGNDFQLSLNISPVQLASTDRSLDTWLPRMRQAKVPPQTLVAEITENIMMEASDRTISELIAFERAGINVALDDFGTGYSSLAYIREYHIDFLKIDRSFVKNLKPESDAVALCEAIIVMAHRLGIRVIAEGVETREQLSLLRGMKCDYGQGYLFSRPIHLDAFCKLSKNFDISAS